MIPVQGVTYWIGERHCPLAWGRVPLGYLSCIRYSSPPCVAAGPSVSKTLSLETAADLPRTRNDTLCYAGLKTILSENNTLCHKIHSVTSLAPPLQPASLSSSRWWGRMVTGDTRRQTIDSLTAFIILFSALSSTTPN